MFSRLLLFFSLFLGVCFKSLGQKRFSAGVYGGMNVSKLRPGKLSESQGRPFSNEYKWTPSYNFGFLLDFKIAERLYFESGINVISKNADNVAPKDMYLAKFFYYDGNESRVFEKHYTSDVQHRTVAFQIPLSLHVVILKKKNFNTNLYLGAFWENLISHKIMTKTGSYWEPENPPQELIDRVNEIEDKGAYSNAYKDRVYNFSKANIGTMFGVGLTYKNAGIDIGMNNPIRNFETLQFKYQSLAVNLRYQFNK